MSSPYDLIIVGAGWYGLAAARTWLELHPHHDVLVLESSDSCGGTWSKDRLYPGLTSNNLYDNYEYPDFPMSSEVYGVKPGEHIPGAVLHQYLTDFAFRFIGVGRIQFNIKVDSIEQLPSNDGWIVAAKHAATGEQISFKTGKLILATGLTSQPYMPHYQGQADFQAPLFHAKDFGRYGSTTETARSAVVIGGAKSAYDVAYAYAQAGATAHLVIRRRGNGPVWISNSHVGPGLRLEKLLTLRFLTWFSPCPFADAGGYSWIRRFLHGTVVGRWIVDAFWRFLSYDTIRANGHLTHPEVQKLQPRNSAFWIGSGLSIHNYGESFWGMVKDGRVRVHIADVDHLSEKKVHLDNGEVLDADALVCATGWDKELAIQVKMDSDTGMHGVEAGLLGLPISSDQAELLSRQADSVILNMFPRLKDRPALAYVPKSGTPHRLYRFIVPPAFIQSRTIAIAGAISTVPTAVTATVQALWIVCYLTERLGSVPIDEAETTREIMLHSQWCKWRHPTGYGRSVGDFAFDGLAYVDLLMRDLRLKVNRKGWWWNDIFRPYGPSDYRGLLEECLTDKWTEKHPAEPDRKERSSDLPLISRQAGARSLHRRR